MRASLSIAFALLACAQCWGASVEEVAERALPSVVRIVTYDVTGTGIAEASGFFVSPRRIITNEHAVDGAYSAEVFSGQG
jgi:S1-C subfamily serine protease